MIKKLINILIRLKIYTGRYLRGYVYKLFIIKKAGKKLLIGKNVQIVHGDFLEIGDNCLIDDNCYINAKSKKGVFIGNNVGLNKGCYLHCFGKREGEGIKIGSHVTIGNNTIIYGSALVKIGNYCALGPNITIVPMNHNIKDVNKPIRMQGLTKKGIDIKENVWLGTGVTVLAGVKIESGSVIGAGAVVNKNIKKNSVAVGVPAKMIKKRRK